MPRGPRGEKRAADVIGNAARVMRIATGEEEEATAKGSKDAAAVRIATPAASSFFSLALPTEVRGYQHPRAISGGPAETARRDCRRGP
jgi:hypothetical protein